jgi:MFS family permease
MDTYPKKQAFDTDTAVRIRSQRRSATLLALTLACSAETWTTSGVSLTLTDLTGTLSASGDEASWTLTVYTTAFAIAVALSHRMALLMGNKWLLTSCSVLYVLASVGCALSTDLMAFLVFRGLAGFSGGVFLVRAFVFFSQQYDPATRSLPSVLFAISYFLLGRVVSPIVSGWVADHSTWRLLFGVEILLMSVAAWIFSRCTEDHWIPREISEPLDYVGIALLVTGAILLQTVFSRGEIDGWFESPFLIALLFGGLGANAIFAMWQLSPKNRYPLLRLAFLRNRSALAGAILGFAFGILLAGSLYVVPQYLRGIEGHSALQTGVLLSIGGGAAVMVLCSFQQVSVLIMKAGGGFVLVVALAVEIISQLLFLHYLTPETPDHDLWLPLALNGVFIALSVPTLGIVAFANIDSQDASNARAMYYGCRQFGASLGVTLATVLIDRRMSLHSARLLDSYAARNHSVVSVASNVGERALSAMVKRQSTVLSYADVFLVMSAVAATTLVLVPLLPRFNRPAGRVPGQERPPLNPVSDLRRMERGHP